ncbi:CHAT domain-containing tetratricopeptide repeat protein [Altererythrobacter lauratis]|uniref:CHAT domain-containing tetratricopeptide repeat protein n=1 Tax=Alteraurantiacibacter lauratis TaxID=2054627 RepID=A0ABV7EG48_9SPHN
MAHTAARLARLALALGASFGLLLPAPPSAAQSLAPSVSLRDSVPIGSDGLCEAQIQSPRPSEGMFDRRYRIVCRDAAASVGEMEVVGGETPPAALARLAGADATCRAAPVGQIGGGLNNVTAQLCSSPGKAVERLILAGTRGGRTFAAAGLAVYADALRLGLATLAGDRLVDGAVNVPLTQAGDAQAFARAQAEAISSEIALSEAYRRSNAGLFAEAAEFFGVSATNLPGQNATEALLNAALQQSNLGNFAEARNLFAKAADDAAGNPLLARLARNFRSLDALNRAEPAEALAVLDAPLPQLVDSMEATLQLQIDTVMAQRLSSEGGNPVAGAGAVLTLAERLQLLDGQATYLRGTAQRLLGRPGEADDLLRRAYADITAVREARVVTVLWLRAQILGDLGTLAEARGETGQAESLHRQAIALLATTYPGSPALASATAQLAGLYARSGRRSEAVALFRQLVADAGDDAHTPALRRHLAPWFALLAEPQANPLEAAEDMFAASQLMLRPGLAQTQAVLARELSGGSDEAAQLFRQSINLGRAIEMKRIEVLRAESQAEQDASLAAALLPMREELDLLRLRQLEVQQQLAAYPRYRAVSSGRIALGELQATLRDGEAYLKLVMLDDAAYAVYADRISATAYRLDASPARIAEMVDILRDSIAIEEGGQTITYPFELGVARQLATVLLGPVQGQLSGVEHLIFEPDGALLRLPINLLVMDDASVDRYAARTADPDADPYDYRGTAWLGRAMQVTTSVSPASFRDLRAARRSEARGEYLGLGQNVPLPEYAVFSPRTRSGIADERCVWSPLTWSNPVKADELRAASAILGSGGAGVVLLTDGDFTDTRLKGMDDLNQYRILHFATHGLVTSPEPECPPRPALLTSFGDAESDGLLSFAEIFDLSLDADLVILSACNTASVGGLAASREAGVTTGGDFALDGLVRAFVGAGGRNVVASHWPVPDDYDATGRLISGFFQADRGQSIGEALRQAQLALMDDADTSHPFYWSAFAVVGDGAIALRR